jgi:hypothetical protein
MIQPVDRHLAQTLKQKIGRILNDRLASDQDFRLQYFGLDGKHFSASEVRILLTHMVSSAWKELSKERNFLALGWHTGCVMPKKGINREEFNIEPIHLTGYSGDLGFDDVVLSENQSPSENLDPPSIDEGDESSSIELPSGGFGALVENEPDEEGEEEDSKAKAKAKKAKAAKAGSKKQVTAAASKKAKLKVEESDSDGSISSSGDGCDSSGTSDEEDGNLSSTSESFEEPRDQERPKLRRIIPSEEDLDDNDQIAFADDPFAEDMMDELSETVAASLPSPPDGYKFVSEMRTFPLLTKLVEEKVYWYIPLCRNGNPGWIIAVIKGGPQDPTASANGDTLSLMCSTRLDKQTPVYLSNAKIRHPVAFSCENYGKRWLLLEELK